VPDDLGRDCVRRQDARRLLDEQRANELRVAKLRQLAEQEAVEADCERRARIWQGVSADAIPVGGTRLLRCCRQPTTLGRVGGRCLRSRLRGRA
jgi:hypothetical protein